MGQNYPTASNVISRLQRARMTPPDCSEITPALLSAIRTWQRQTGWLPFLNYDASGDDPPGPGPAVSTRTFDPPGPRQPGGWMHTTGGGLLLRLSGGLLSLSSITINGAPYELGTQCWLYPAEAPDNEWPYTSIRFMVAPWGPNQSVAVTGVWGYCSSLNFDVYNAILARTCWLLAPEISADRSGGMASWKEGATEERYAMARDTGPWSDVRGDWDRQWTDALGDYVRLGR